ncbi:MAG: DoxX family protein [Gemmatimonadaceae bacterium]|nr:DoxX family protein [Gemmatimonadaceae bacterium]
MTFVPAVSGPVPGLEVGLGLLIARLVVGGYMAAHGAQKLWGWFGGYGLDATAGFFEGIGYRPGRLFVAMAAGTEVLSGLLVMLGLLGPVGPALMIAVMIVAAVTVHWAHGWFVASNGIELTLMFSSSAVVLALTGFGSLSLDHVLQLTGYFTPTLTSLVIVGGLIGGVVGLAIRSPQVQES